MNIQTTTAFRRRRDGVLEILPRVDPAETAKRAEIAIAVLILIVGGGAAFARNVAIAVLLLAGGTGLLATRLVSRYRVLRAARRSLRERPALPGSEGGARQRVIRLEEHVARPPPVLGTAPTIPGGVGTT